MRRAMNALRRFGVWLSNWPCALGVHEFGKYRPGRVMWSRECACCGKIEFGEPQSRADVDPRTWNIYADRHGLERMK